VNPRVVGLLDANIFIHAQTDDPQAGACLRLIEELEAGTAKGLLHPLVLHEISYVVQNPRFLKWTRQQTADFLISLASAPGVELIGADAAVVLDGLLRWRSGDVSFVDAMLCAESQARSLAACTVNRSDFEKLGVHCVTPELDADGALYLR